MMKGVKSLKFRRLRADEIDCRVAQVSKAGSLMLLLYKDARCDMNILDESVGSMNWQRSHSRDNANCTVSIWDEDKHQWVSKEDTGTESNTEKEKGLASDSFKRACFNWGIGRELYTAPTIWIKNTDYEPGGKSTYDNFVVKDIEYDEAGRISKLVIRNETQGKDVYKMGKTKNNPNEDARAVEVGKQVINEIKLRSLMRIVEEKGIDADKLAQQYGKTELKDFTEKDYSDFCLRIEKLVKEESKA